METLFIEQLVKKKKTAADFVALVAMLALGAALITFLLMFALPLFFQFAAVILVLVMAVVYGVYYFLASFDVEYEYSLVNQEIDVDKILGKKRRKRLVTVYYRDLEAFGTKANPDFNMYMQNAEVKKVFACRDKNASDVFFVVYYEGQNRIMLLFNPNDKIIEQIKMRNPKKVLI